MKKTKYYDKAVNICIQPDPYFLYELPRGSFMALHNDIDVIRDESGEIVKDCSGYRFKIYKEGVIPEQVPVGTVVVDKNLLQLNVSGHYWHFHHETLGQFLIYKDLNVFDRISPENTAILLTRTVPYDFAKDAFKHVFGFDITEYEMILVKKNTLYTTTKDLIASTKTSTAGVLPLSYFSEKLAKYLVPEENPTDFIYISRDDSDCRLLLNQDEILQYLNENGIPIRKVTMTGMPYLEQVNLFRNSKLVITISGSGSTNQIYCNPDKSKVLFIAPKKGALNCSSYTAKKMNMGCTTLEGHENFTPENKHRASDPTCANFKLLKEDVLKVVQDLLADKNIYAD